MKKEYNKWWPFQGQPEENSGQNAPFQEGENRGSVENRRSPIEVPKCSQRAKAVVGEIAASNPNSLEEIRESRTFDYSCRGTLKSLFHGDPEICLGSGQKTEVRFLSEWGDQAEKFEFIVPVAMKANGGTPNDMLGGFQHLDPAGAYRYLVLEFPCFSIEEQAALHLFLDSKLPLSLLFHSERALLQGWFYVLGKPEDVVSSFMSQVIRLGANPAAWNQFQPVKLPGGGADDGFEQTVEFFNPAYGGLYK